MIVMPPEGGWLRLADGAVAARGSSADALPEGERIVAVLPGEDVTVRWIDLPAMPLPQAAAAARLMAAEFAADPIEALHVAVGDPDSAGRRAVALVRLSAMRALLDSLAERGITPNHIVPEPTLIAPPADGLAAVERRGLVLIRGRETAVAIDSAMAEMMAPDAARLPPRTFEDTLAAALAVAPVDLRQGAFAAPSALRPAREWTRRMMRLAAALALISLAVPVVEIVKLRRATARDAAELTQVARGALPQAVRIANAPAQLSERIATLRGGGLGFGATVGALFAVVAADGDARLESVEFGRDGVARATVSASSAARLAAVADRIRTSGLAAQLGPARGEGGRQLAELAVSPS